VPGRRAQGNIDLRQPQQLQQLLRIGNSLGQFYLPRRRLPRRGTSGYHTGPKFTVNGNGDTSWRITARMISRADSR
jgi:hypothetical protein